MTADDEFMTRFMEELAKPLDPREITLSHWRCMPTRDDVRALPHDEPSLVMIPKETQR